MIRDTTQALIDLTGAVSHDPDEADWYDVEEIVDLLSNPSAVLLELLHYAHEEGWV